jgi:tetratricopeptide (TPR) repeat protein
MANTAKPANTTNTAKPAKPAKKAPFGMNEREKKLLVKATVISTFVCAAIIGVFWALKIFDIDPAALLHDPKSVIKSAFFGGGESDLNVMDVNEFDLEAHEFTAQRYMQSGRPDAAIPHLQRMAAVRKDNRAALDGMVKAYLELGDFEKALNYADHLISSMTEDSLPVPSDLQVRRGIALYNLKRGEESAEVIRGVLQREPQNAAALCFMGEIEAAHPESKEAENYFRRSIEADSNYTEARYQLARYYEAGREYDKAQALLQQVLAKDPLNVRAHARLGMIYYYKLDTEQALKSYQTALALNPYDYNTRYNLGELYRTLLEDNEQALEEFVLAISGNPNHGEANYKAGLICAQNGMLKEAIRYFEASLKNDRRHVNRLMQLAAAYERIGDTHTALSVYLEVTDIDPLYTLAIQKIKLLENPE